MKKLNPNKGTAYPLFKPDTSFPPITPFDIAWMKKQAYGVVPDWCEITPKKMDYPLICLTEELVQHMVKQQVQNPLEDIKMLIDIADVRVRGWIHGESVGHVGYKRSIEGQKTFVTPVDYPLLSWGGLDLNTEKLFYPGVMMRARYVWIVNMYAYQQGMFDNAR